MKCVNFFTESCHLQEPLRLAVVSDSDDDFVSPVKAKAPPIDPVPGSRKKRKAQRRVKVPNLLVFLGGGTEVLVTFGGSYRTF